MNPIINLTNIPAPYREKFHEIISDHFNGKYEVIYCAKSEPNRKWKFPYGNYKKTFLSPESNTFIHNNPNIWRVLNTVKPSVVISTGFNPTMIYAFTWCLLNRAKHICFSDGTLKSEEGLTIAHRMIRKLFFSRSKAFVAASKGGEDLFLSYQVPKKKIFRSYLCIQNENFVRTGFEEKEYDLMFSGQFIERKMPFFFVEVAKKIKELRGKCKVLLIGDGELRNEVLRELDFHGIDYYYPGYLDQTALPQFYAKAKLFLFPTQNDPWGVVVNEAMASGLPVITCENAGVSDDLVERNVNGYILPLEADIWVKHCIDLLDNKELYETFSSNAYRLVQIYNFNNAAQGVINSVEFALANQPFKYLVKKEVVKPPAPATYLAEAETPS